MERIKYSDDQVTSLQQSLHKGMQKLPETSASVQEEVNKLFPRTAS